MQTEARVGGVVDGGGGGSRAAVGRCQEQCHIGTAAHLAAGGFAGAVSKTCTAPLARLTILFQVEFLPAYICNYKTLHYVFMLYISVMVRIGIEEWRGMDWGLTPLYVHTQEASLS